MGRMQFTGARLGISSYLHADLWEMTGWGQSLIICKDSKQNKILCQESTKDHKFADVLVEEIPLNENPR